MVSDVHVDEWPEEVPDNHRAKRRAFLDFLRWVRDESGVDLVVVNGDMVDIPQKDDTPFLPTYFDIVDIFFEMYRSGIGIAYLAGNHDAGIPSICMCRGASPTTPPYPFLIIKSGDATIVVEHGHLVDAWLWAYVRQRVSLMTPPRTGEAMEHFTTPALAPSDRYQPRWSSVGRHVFHSLQWEPNGLQFTDDEIRIGLSLMAHDLQDDFADVRRDGEPFPEQEHALELLAGAGVDVADLRHPDTVPDAALEYFKDIGDVYYSRFPWRRAARNRLRQIRHVFNHDPDAIVFGHIHKIDHNIWEENGTPRHYYNDGSWKNRNGDFLYIEDGEVRAFDRAWDEPLPL